MTDTKQDDFGVICKKWWSVLTNKDIGRSRADLARLKRADSAVNALTVRSTHDLNRQLAEVGHDLRHKPDVLALIAMSLAHVKNDDNARMARKMGQGDPKPLSEIRFDRLIRTKNRAELTTQLRRALAVVGNSANVARLANDLRWWNNDSTRATWCFDYYGAPQAAPQEAQENSEETKND